MRFWRRIASISQYIRDLFLPTKINELEFCKATWTPCEREASTRLGTGEEASKTLKGILVAIYAHRCKKRFNSYGFARFWHECRNQGIHEDIAEFLDTLSTTIGIIGDPKDIHHIIPPCHSFGYAIFRSKDGVLIKEEIEGLRIRIQVLRRRNQIIAINSYRMLRHESYRGVRVI